SIPLQATGGFPPYNWSAAPLPPGLSLNAGVITGVPTTTGTFNFNATVSDSTGASQVRGFAIIVGSSTPPPNGPVITNTSFPGGPVGQTHRQSITFTTSCTSPFGNGPTLAVTSGSLPPGLTVNSPVDKSWVISGTPTANGTYNFSLTITEVCGRASTAN